MFTKLVTIGRDSELRFTQNQKAVTSIACAYDIGWGENKKTQWIEVSLWGKQAEALTQYLTKGKQIVVYADDVEVETYQKNDGTQGVKLKARAINIDLTRSTGMASQPQQQNGFKQAPQQQAPQQAPQKINPQEPAMDFDDDIPF